MGQEKKISRLPAFGPYGTLGPMALWALWLFGPYGPSGPMALWTLWTLGPLGPLDPMALWAHTRAGRRMMNTREDDEY